MEPAITSMHVEVARAVANGNLVIDETRHSQLFLKDAFLVVLAHANARISLQAGLAGLWLPLFGRSSFATINAQLVSAKGAVYASDSQRRLTVDVGRKAACVAIVARQNLWAGALASWQTSPTRPYTVLPALHASARLGVRRGLLRFVREAARGDCTPHPNFTLLASALGELQAGFEPLIQRCPGASVVAKRSNFFRLQRALNQILFADKEQPKVTELASLANYSVHQFIRVFSKVYGCTPHNYMSRLRAARAHAILTSSDLAVRDVAAALGIESRATFGRMVKKNFGQSATLMRRVARSV